MIHILNIIKHLIHFEEKYYGFGELFRFSRPAVTEVHSKKKKPTLLLVNKNNENILITKNEK